MIGGLNPFFIRESLATQSAQDKALARSGLNPFFIRESLATWLRLYIGQHE